MTDEQLAQNARDANLTYLMLAQNVIRKDKAEVLLVWYLRRVWLT
jgi:flagellar transcriptional activator FlhD